MKMITEAIRRHPVSAFYLLSFTVSWTGVLLAAGGPAGLPADEDELDRLLPVVVIAMVAGPLLAGPLITALVSGRAGFHRIRQQIQIWRVHPAWYALALLTGPVVVLAAALPLSAWSADFMPTLFTADEKTPIVLSGLIAGLVAGICEELGWTAFAVTHLRTRHTVVPTGLIVGSLWGLWHLGVAYWGAGTPDGHLSPLTLATQLTFYLGVLPAYRILMVWQFTRTGSLTLAILMHAGLTGSTTFILASDVGDLQRLALYLAEAGICWAIVAVAAGSGALQDPTTHGNPPYRMESTKASA